MRWEWLFGIGVLIMTSDDSYKNPTPAELPSRPGFPDPLLRFDGTRVATPKDWFDARKPELKKLFEQYMYGAFLPPPKTLTAKVLFEDPKAIDGLATLRELELRADDFDPVRVLLVVPNTPGRKPCFVGPNFGGNHVLTDDVRVRVPTTWMYDKYPGVVANQATDAGRGKQADSWPLRQIVRRGYAVATFYNGEVQPDRPTANEGMRAKLQPADAPPDRHPNIMLWAWFTSRVVDHLVTRPDVDPKRIAVVGHSRLGKTALLAGAFDDRIAVVIPSQAGCGGTGPSRHTDPKAESVKRINTAFPHWFCANFKAFNDATEKLPFDQHCLVSLCAPRPVLYPNAAEDLWANPAGQFEMLKQATAVYKLLGVDGLEVQYLPPHGQLVASRLGYFVRSGVHAMTPTDWTAYLDFADKWLK